MTRSCRTRTWALALVALLAPALPPAARPALAQLAAGALPPTKATIDGPAIFDVSKFGAVAGSTSATLNVALKAIKAAATAQGVTYGQIYIPATPTGKPYYFTKGLWVPGGWDVVGAGRDKSALQNVPGWDSSALVMGMRADDGQAAANHWQALGSMVDANWQTVTGGGARNGYRICAAGGAPAGGDPSLIQLAPNCLAYGRTLDGWGSDRGFTCEVLGQGYTLLAGTPNTVVPGLIPPGSVFGLADDQGAPSPWYIIWEGGGGTYVSGTGTTPTINVPQVRFEAITGGGPGYITFTSGVLKGQTFQVLSGTNPTGDNYALTLSAALPGAPAANDGVVYYTGVSIHCRAATGLLNGVAGQYDPTYGGATYVATFRLPAVGPAAIVQPQRWIFQVDLAATTAANFAQAAVSCGSSAAPSFAWLATPGLTGTLPVPNPKFQENGYVPFEIGSVGAALGVEAPIPYPKTYQYATTTGGVDWLVGGLSVVACAAGGNVYTPGTAGTQPAVNPAGPRAGLAPTDGARYALPGVTNAVGWLPLDSSGTDDYGGHYAQSQSPYGPCGGWTWGFVKGPGNGFMLASTVRDLSLTSTGRGGNGIEIGYCINQSYRNLHISGFANSIGDHCTNSNYPQTIENLIAAFPSQAAIYGYEGNFWVQRLVESTPSRSCIRMAGCGLTLKSAFFGANNGSVALAQHNVDFSGSWLLEDVSWDSEGAGVPPVALIDWQADNAPYSFLTIRNSALGYVGPNSVHVRLRGAGGGTVNTAIENCTWAYHNTGPYAFATVDTDTVFTGAIDNCAPNGGWNLAATTLPFKSFAANGQSGVNMILDLPGVTLPPALTGVPPGTIARNRKAPASGVTVESIMGTDGAWHPLRTIP